MTIFPQTLFSSAPPLRHSQALSRSIAPRPSLFQPFGAVNPNYVRTARSVLFPDTPQEYKRGVPGYVKQDDLPNGIVLWEGPSRFDGAPIVVILTAIYDTSDNEKTGDMIQSWIMRSDVAPHIALNTGADASVCASCPKRPAIVYAGATPVYGNRGGTRQIIRYKTPGGGRVKATDSCYVAVHNAPRQIWASYRAGEYPRVNTATAVRLVQGRVLRIGSYGDPVAAPLEAWLPVIHAARGRTGYTHQWCDPSVQVWRPYLQASVDSRAEADRANAMGWKYFYVGEEPLQPGEQRCPASKEMGNLLTCVACRKCSGAEGAGKRPSIVIRPH